MTRGARQRAVKRAAVSAARDARCAVPGSLSAAMRASHAQRIQYPDMVRRCDEPSFTTGEPASAPVSISRRALGYVAIVASERAYNGVMDYSWIAGYENAERYRYSQ